MNTHGMKGVTFPVTDKRTNHHVGLSDILKTIGSAAPGTWWKLERLECAGHPTKCRDLYAIEARSTLVPTQALQQVAGPDVQIIDGDVIGFGGPGAIRPKLLVRAVDGTDWDVYSHDDEMLQKIAHTFQGATAVPM